VRFDTGTERLEIFSDAVIAIAITLLVLDIKVPDSRNGQLFHDLWQRWPSYVAYVLSFAIIGIMWVSHHSMFEHIHHVDRRLLFINLWLLLGIAFLPFPTALLAQYARQGDSNSHAAAAIYSATMAFIGLAFLAIWLHLARNPALVGNVGGTRLRRSINLSLVSPVVYGLSIGLAFVSAEACLVVYSLAALYFAFGPSSRVLSRPVDGLLEVATARSSSSVAPEGGHDGRLPDAGTSGDVVAGPRPESESIDTPDPRRNEPTNPVRPPPTG
jgi:uncharacterized membrane protein